jgi:hypothetical protein
MNWKIQGFTAVVALLLLASTVPAAESIATLQQAKAKEICSAVKKTIAEGVDTKVVVRTAITLGHNACQVVQCAIEGGGGQEQVIAGAISCGTPSEVVSRCAIDAGVSAGDVASILSLPEMQLNLCYFRPERPELLPEDIPRTDPLPSTVRGNTISPYNFP